MGQLGFNFLVEGPVGAREVRVEKTIATLGNGDRLVLRSSKNKPVALVPDEWPDSFADSVAKRMEARGGRHKGRVLVVWLESDAGSARPIAACAWHVHEGNWPLAILDAAVANAVSGEQAVFLQRTLVAALGELAAHPKFKDTAVPRPSDRVLWRVDDEPPGPNRPARRARARAAASRGQAQFGAVRVPKGARPAWAKDGFLGRIDVEKVDAPDRG